jgi:hypothetical protein
MSSIYIFPHAEGDYQSFIFFVCHESVKKSAVTLESVNVGLPILHVLIISGRKKDRNKDVTKVYDDKSYMYFGRVRTRILS